MDRLSQGALCPRAPARGTGDLRLSEHGDQHQIEPPASPDSFRAAAAAHAQAHRNRSVDRRECVAGARRDGARVARAAHGISRALEAREYVSGCTAGARPSTYAAHSHLVQPDGRDDGTPLLERTESPEYSHSP